MKLKQLGWTPFFERAFSALSDPSLIPARIVRHDRHSYKAITEDDTYSATLLGRLLYSETDAAALPAVGDWVALQTFDDNQGVIHHVLPRFGAFYRKEAGQKTRRQIIAANIDRVFLVNGLDHDFNIRRIERYLVQANSSGAEPIIVLNKIDLCEDVEPFFKEIRRIAPDVDVIGLSAKEDLEMDQLKAYISDGITVAFIGSSGVGKSSLVNRLLGESQFKTGEVREDDSRGRHTTSHRELVVLPDGGLVIDTPGLRELQLWGDEEDLHSVFTDIETLASACRFRDCQHDTEPGCAIHEALDSGELDRDRFESYNKLKRELAYLERRQSEAGVYEARKHEKDLGKMYKAVQRANPKRR